MTAGRLEYLQVLAELIQHEIVVAYMGDATRDWAQMLPRSRNFYLCGAMGHAISLATGLALALPEDQIIVFEGDGGLLLNLGSLVTAAGLQLPNLKILLFNNEEYESSGHQPLPRLMIDYEGVARSIGIECVGTVGDTTKFRETLLKHLATPATSFLCLRLGPRVVPRASFEKRPLQIRFEFMQALNTGRR